MVSGCVDYSGEDGASWMKFEPGNPGSLFQLHCSSQLVRHSDRRAKLEREKKNQVVTKRIDSYSIGWLRQCSNDAILLVPLDPHGFVNNDQRSNSER